MDKNILRAYDILKDVTPAVFDCGDLCGKLCCKGEGEIWLLPGEEEYYSGVPGFEIADYGEEKHLVCNTDCSKNRDLRPFFCRIYPLFPHVVKDGDGNIEVTLVYDPRSARCPLTNLGVGVTRRFCRRVSIAVKMLARDEKMFEFFRESAEFIDEMMGLAEKLNDLREKNDE